APRLDGVLEDGDELVTEVNEGHVSRSAAQLQLRKERAPEVECLLEAADVERDVIDPQRASHRGSQRGLCPAIPDRPISLPDEDADDYQEDDVCVGGQPHARK